MLQLLWKTKTTHFLLAKNLSIIHVWFVGYHIWSFLSTGNHIWPCTITKNHIWPWMITRFSAWPSNRQQRWNHDSITDAEISLCSCLIYKVTLWVVLRSTKTCGVWRGWLRGRKEEISPLESEISMMLVCMNWGFQ